MAFWQALKGVLTHSTPDWFIDKLAFISVNCNGDPNHSWVYLWNDSTPPVSFFIYKLTISSANTNDLWQGFPQGTNPGTVQQHAYPVNLASATPPGHTYTVGGSSPNVGFDCPLQVAQSLQLDPIVLDAHFPLFIVAPNSGFAISPSGGGGINFFVTFWYVYK
jgi:hypothetical protein